MLNELRLPKKGTAPIGPTPDGPPVDGVAAPALLPLYSSSDVCRPTSAGLRYISARTSTSHLRTYHRRPFSGCLRPVPQRFIRKFDTYGRC